MLLAATDTFGAKDVPLSPSVNVPAEPAVLLITILVTTVVVVEGTVYSVADDVANAPRPSALVTVAISYYPFVQIAPIRMSVNSSLILPVLLSTTSVNPEIVVIVTPDVTTVVPSVGAEYPATDAHWVPVPVDCKY